MASKHAHKELERNDSDTEQLYRALFENNYSAMLLIDPETGDIKDANPSACLFYGYTKDELIKLQITDINTHSKKEIFMEMERAKCEKRNYFNFKHRLSNGVIKDVEVFSGPIIIRKKFLLCSVIHDISKRISIEKQRERLIDELQNALAEVKKLRGFLPICSSCKKIRDDKGYWNQIESYIRDHSEAEFTHSICPECAKKLYPGLSDK